MKENNLICKECAFETKDAGGMTDHLTKTGHDLSEVTTDKRIAEEGKEENSKSHVIHYHKILGKRF